MNCEKCKKPIKRTVVPDRICRVFDGEIETYRIDYTCPCGFSNESVNSYE